LRGLVLDQEVAVNRTELIDAVSADTGLTRNQSEAALDAIVYQVTAGVRGGSPVRITGFGTFKLRERQARKGRNPQTGEAVRIKASKGIGFTPGVKLKADLNARGALSKPKSLAVKVAPKSAAATVRGASKSANGRRTAASAPVAKAPAARKTAAAPRKTVAKAAPAARKVAAKKAGARR
jgi:DNA-binding protein HU-beta